MTASKTRLAAVDIDSTLVVDGGISDENRKAIQSLTAAGVQVVLPTGRSFHHTLPCYHRLNLNTPIVTTDGALVMDCAAGAVLSETFLPRDISSFIMHAAADSGITCLNFVREGIATTSRFDWATSLERHAQEMGRRFRSCTAQKLCRRSVFKAHVYCREQSSLQTLVDLVTCRFADSVEPVFCGRHGCELVVKGVSKLSALETLAARLGIRPQQVIAFGDGLNDIGMLSWAGMSFCMFHGTEAAKQAAHRVAPATEPRVNLAAAIADPATKKWLND
jgi:hypothetical protein